MEFNQEMFIYRLTVLMEENDMSQIKLAKKIGTTNVTISRYLSGERIPRIEILVKMANVFSVSLDFLLGYSDEKNALNNNIFIDTNLKNLIEYIISVNNNSKLSNSQIELIKKLISANKDFIISA